MSISELYDANKDGKTWVKITKDDGRPQRNIVLRRAGMQNEKWRPDGVHQPWFKSLMLLL